MAALIALALTPVWFTICQLLATLAYVAHRDAREREEFRADMPPAMHAPRTHEAENTGALAWAA